VLANIVLVPFSPLYYLGIAAHALITLIIGVICVIGSRRVARLKWAVVLIILGIVAGGVGGTVVIVEALPGVLSRLI
jgi:hypothetical protein